MIRKRTTKVTIIILIALLSIILFCLCGCNKNDPFAQNDINYFSVRYIASSGGKIEGKDNQLVKLANSTEEVRAVANSGYYFVKWSDGLTSETRKENYIVHNAEFVAEFAPITNGVNLNYSVIGACNNAYIVGKTHQVVRYGMDGEEVEIKFNYTPSDGRRFLGWSDGNKDLKRKDLNVIESIDVVAIIGYSLTYEVQGNGRIIGEKNQSITYANNGQPVTAVPDEGYTFIGWSDGVKSATRTDGVVVQDKHVVAQFEWRNVDDFKYNYNYATGNYGKSCLTIIRKSADEVKSIVPIREFFKFDGWFLDKGFTKKAFDECGNSILGEEIFNSSSRDLYAKWTVNEECIVTYKILMVYVTSIDAKLKDIDGNIIKVRYEMNDIERQSCYNITQKFSDTINQMMDGLIHFEVDSYFTTETLDEKSINNEAYRDGTYIYANNIGEIVNSGILENYRSVLTTFSLNNEQKLYPRFSGIAERKYASIPVDKYNIFRRNMSYDDSYHNIDEYIDNSVYNDIDTYVHEFIHTIELSMTCFSYHKSIFYDVPLYITDKLFMLNQFPTTFSNANSDFHTSDEIYNLWANSSARVGISYYAWANEFFDVEIRAECINGRPDGSCGDNWHDYGGNIYGNASVENWVDNNAIDYIQRVPNGGRTTILFPKANFGYKFIGWSDGYDGESRIIENVSENMTIIAYFERISFSAEYLTTEGGYIDGGPINQTALYGEIYEEVRAVAYEGYRFVQWSDGETDPHRSDWSGGRYYDTNSGEWLDHEDFTVIAIFEKIEK